jgi:predicted transcriptional regulator
MLESNAQEILKELEALKRLKILEMIDRGYSQAQIAAVLGGSQPTISRMFPKGVLNKKS